MSSANNESSGNPESPNLKVHFYYELIGVIAAVATIIYVVVQLS